MDDVVGCERLVLVRLADVFVEGRKEEIEQVLPLRRLVVDIWENAVVYEVENLLKLLLFQLADTLGVNNLRLQNNQLFGLVEALVKQRFKLVFRKGNYQ